MAHAEELGWPEEAEEGEEKEEEQEEEEETEREEEREEEVVNSLSCRRLALREDLHAEFAFFFIQLGWTSSLFTNRRVSRSTPR